VRASVGASRGRIFVQFLIESLALASFGGALGLGLAWALLKIILATMPPGTLLSEADVRLNLPVLLFTLAITMLAGILFGCAPALQATRLNLNEVLKEGGRSAFSVGRQGLRRGLVVAEFALALSLLAGGGLALHSLWNLAHEDLGFPTDHLLTFFSSRSRRPAQGRGPDQHVLSAAARPDSSSSWRDRSLRVYRRTSGRHFGMSFQIAGKPNIEDLSARPNAGFRAVTPGYSGPLGFAWNEDARSRSRTWRAGSGGDCE